MSISRFNNEFVREEFHESQCERLADNIVGTSAAARARNCRAQLFSTQGDASIPDLKDLIALRITRDEAHGLAKDAGKCSTSLDFGALGRIFATARHSWDDVTDGHLDNSGLSKGGENLLDITQEGPRRADDQYPGTFKAFALGIEQVGCAVKSNGRLPGSRSSLDDKDPAVTCSNHSILLALNRCDDIAHSSASCRRQSRHQCSFALQG